VDRSSQIHKDIIEMIGLSEREFFWLKVELGCTYLEDVLQLDKWSFNQLTGSETFWNWWRMKWSERDRKFLKEFDAEFRSVRLVSLVQMQYFEMHSLDYLKEKKYSNILDQSFGTMVGHLIKSVTK